MPAAIVSATAVRRALAQKVAAVDTSILMLIKGAPLPDLSAVEEWIQFDVLSNMPAPTQKNAAVRSYLVQLICFARYANRRQDRKVDRPYELADIYSAALTNAEVDAAENGNTSCVRVNEPKQIYLDLTSSGEFSKQIYLQSTPMETHCIVMLFEAVQLDSI